jgi:casein kinase II subunit beta
MLESGSDSDYQKYWIDWFLSHKGHEFFCEVDEEYIMDRFNLTGLNTEVQYYPLCMDTITDNLGNTLCSIVTVDRAGTGRRVTRSSGKEC